MTPAATVRFIKAYSTRNLFDALSFHKHVFQIRERRGDPFPPAWYQRPYVYSLRMEKAKIKGSGDELVIPARVLRADYEFELVGIFREPIKTADINEAITFVKEKMLFTIFNDMSARDLQAEDMKVPLSVSPSKGVCDKSFGPNVVPGAWLKMDENGIPNIAMRLLVNGEERCNDNFQSIYFTDPDTREKKCWGFAEVIAWFGSISQGFEEGDLLGSGTIGNGSIAEHAAKIDPVNGKEIEPAHYSWLKEGDVVRMEVEGIGVLENTVRFIDLPNPRKE